MVKLVRLLVVLATLWSATAAWAITVTAERQIVPLNETLRINISSSSGDLDNIDLAGIEEHFDIVGRSSQRSVSIVNGRTESVATLALTVMPRELGSFFIPALEHNKLRSKPVKVTVIKALPVPDKMADQSVIVESEVDQQQAKVGEQILYTYRVIYSVQLSNPEISAFNADNADIKVLEDKNYQRNINGKRYNVAEKRYALFFDRPGNITLQPQTLGAIVSNRRHGSLGFDPFARGTQLRLASKPIELVIEPMPADADAAQWLAASELSLSETALPTQTRVGEPISRAIRIFAKSVNAERLPEITMAAPASANLYYEKPTLTNQEWVGGLAGERIETLAVVPTEEGRIELPGVEVRWWNTTTDRWETATLPAHSIDVLPAISQPDSTISVAPPLLEIASAGETTVTESTAGPAQAGWQKLALLFGAGWLLTALALVLLVLNRKNRDEAPRPPTDSAVRRNAETLKSLKQHALAACADNAAAQARSALDRWLLAYTASRSTAEALASIDNAALTAASRQLDEALFSNQVNHEWSGSALAGAIANLPPASVRQSKPILSPLYPEHSR